MRDTSKHAPAATVPRGGWIRAPQPGIWERASTAARERLRAGRGRYNAVAFKLRMKAIAFGQWIDEDERNKRLHLISSWAVIALSGVAAYLLGLHLYGGPE